MAIDSNRIGVRIKFDRQGRRLERHLALEGQAGLSPGGRTKEVSEKSFDTTTNLVGGKEHQKTESLHGCSTCLVFGLMISHRNLASFDSCAANGEVSPGEDAKELIW